MQNTQELQLSRTLNELDILNSWVFQIAKMYFFKKKNKQK